MQKLGTLINQVSQNAPQTPAKSGSAPTYHPATDRLMASLWERLAHIYGHKFTATFGVSAIVDGELSAVAKTWASGLSGISGEEIAKGLHAMCERADAWPPTLPEFRAACLGKKSGPNEYGLDFVPEYYRQQPISEKAKLLSSDERDARREAVGEKISALRDALKK